MKLNLAQCNASPFLNKILNEFLNAPTRSAMSVKAFDDEPSKASLPLNFSGASWNDMYFPIHIDIGLLTSDYLPRILSPVDFQPQTFNKYYFTR